MWIRKFSRACSLLLAMFSVFSLHAQTVSDTSALRVGQLLDRWHADAANCNHAAYIGAMTPNGVFIGTDATERWTTTEFSGWSKPFFERKHTWSFRALSRQITVSENGNTAWFDELLQTQMGLCRGSGVLVRQNSSWEIAQYVLSATIPNDIMKQVTAMKSSADSNLLLKTVFDKYAMNGTILLFDPAKNQYAGYNPARWDSGYLPASTFKVPNSLIGLETGVIDTNYIFRWDGKKRRLPQWEKDLTLREAYRVSCVPCYQELARRIGPQRMALWLERFEYGKMTVTPQNIDLFWLEGEARITPAGQVRFLQKLHDEKLPLKPETMRAMKPIMVNEVTREYTLSGKTGWAVRNGNNYGWFVGWIETRGKVYYIATLVEPKNNAEISDFAMARKAITMECLRALGVIE